MKYYYNKKKRKKKQQQQKNMNYIRGAFVKCILKAWNARVVLT
jgi:hypothetical protein